MTLDEYLPYWEKAKPLMLGQMTWLRAALIPIIDFKVTEPCLNEGSDEFSVGMDIIGDDGTAIVNIDFTLTDADVSGDVLLRGEDGGVGVSFTLTGYNALVLGGFSPYNYTNNVFTNDTTEMLGRIEMLDATTAAVYIKYEALTNETLLRECSAASRGAHITQLSD